MALWIPLEKNGRVVFAIPQNRHDDYSAAPSYRVFDEAGKTSFMVGSMDELLGMGYRPSAAKANARELRAKGVPKGAGGGNSAPGGGNIHIAMLNAGYVWDKDQKWYFKAGTDLDGKPQADYRQPASMGMYREMVRRYGGKAAFGGG